MGMSEGKIIKWHKAIGDLVKEDEPLAEIESEKSTDTLESPGAGRLNEIIVKEGETAEVRSVVAVIVTE
jgi:pyruvate/2-oxoglutarate dehydrogenase complex dihydrolipoamide acyltransferase (E2) component